jgi:hypothetical protein
MVDERPVHKKVVMREEPGVRKEPWVGAKPHMWPAPKPLGGCGIAKHSGHKARRAQQS